MGDTTEAAILKALHAHEGLGLGDGRGLMTKEVAERTKLTLDQTQTALNDMARRGLVHHSTFHWYLGSDSDSLRDGGA